MVVLAAAILTKTGKTLVSRQFVEMSRIRIEGLLAAFPKLMGSGKQYTYLETDTVRYVYQPIETLFLGMNLFTFFFVLKISHSPHNKSEQQHRGGFGNSSASIVLKGTTSKIFIFFVNLCVNVNCTLKLHNAIFGFWGGLFQIIVPNWRRKISRRRPLNCFLPLMR